MKVRDVCQDWPIESQDYRMFSRASSRRGLTGMAISTGVPNAVATESAAVTFTSREEIAVRGPSAEGASSMTR